MLSTLSPSAIRDNHFCGRVGDFLRCHLNPGAKLSVQLQKDYNEWKKRAAPF